ncbi:MAG: TetR family transcriptional regulator [Firmicutes bacterium]|nr:TetR family transcriptional regulator [Bacillota bacterium]
MGESIFKKQFRDPHTAEERRKQQILETAALVFARLGYAASIDQIAEEMGVTKGHIYYYFSSKQEILFQIFRQAMDLFLAQISAVNILGLPPDQRLKAIFKKHISAICENRAIMTVFMDLRRDLSPEHWSEIANSRNAYEELLQELIREGEAKGFFAVEHEKVISYLLLGSINWVYVWYQESGEHSVETLAEMMSDYLLRGLKKWPTNGSAQSCREISDIRIGEIATFSRIFTANDIQVFTGVSGGCHAVCDAGRLVVQNQLIAALTSPVADLLMQHVGTMVRESVFTDENPVFEGDRVTVKAEVVSIDEQHNTVSISLRWTNQDDLPVASGRAVVEHPA